MKSLRNLETFKKNSRNNIDFWENIWKMTITIKTDKKYSIIGGSGGEAPRSFEIFISAEKIYFMSSEFGGLTRIFLEGGG